MIYCFYRPVFGGITMKKMLVPVLLLAIGCASTPPPKASAVAAPLTASAAAPVDVAEPLAGYRADQTHQLVGMSYLNGDLISADVFDLRLIPDTDGDLVAFKYRYAFGRGERALYADYENVPAVWGGVGFGTWGFDFIIRFDYDLSWYNAGFKVPIGQYVSFTANEVYTSVEDVLDNNTQSTALVTIYPVENLYVGLGYRLDWFDFTTLGKADFNNFLVNIGYLAGRMDQGVELLAGYKDKEDNGTDNQAEYYDVGLKWHINHIVAIGGSYEEVNGDFDEGNTVTAGAWLCPDEGVIINLLYEHTKLEPSNNNCERVTGGVSFAF
jgi:hypothetical protein